MYFLKILILSTEFSHTSNRAEVLAEKSFKEFDEGFLLTVSHIDSLLANDSILIFSNDLGPIFLDGTLIICSI
jgi:hypothetical protein